MSSDWDLPIVWVSPSLRHVLLNIYSSTLVTPKGDSVNTVPREANYTESLKNITLLSTVLKLESFSFPISLNLY